MTIHLKQILYNLEENCDDNSFGKNNLGFEENSDENFEESEDLDFKDKCLKEVYNEIFYAI